MSRLAPCVVAARWVTRPSRPPSLALPGPPRRCLLPRPRPRLVHRRRASFASGASGGGAASSADAAAPASDSPPASPSPVPRVLILAGPTAVGKTSLSLAVAKALDGEIVSADSVQVFRGLDVGSSKLPLRERRGVRHHLIDVADPSEELGAGDFCRLAWAAIDDIASRGKTPVVVGGTGFYLRWLVEGAPAVPPSRPESFADAARRVEEAVRAATTTEGSENSPEDLREGSEESDTTDPRGWLAATALLRAAGDPETADALAANDWYRLRRALEIVTVTGGVPKGAFRDTPRRPPYDFRGVVLTLPRVELYRRIDARSEAMIRDGVLDEAAAMLERGVTADSAPAARAIGYRQAIAFLVRRVSLKRGEEGEERPPYDGRVTHAELAAFVEETRSATRAFAKRQLTWFRGEPPGRYAWLDASKASSEEELVRAVLAVFHEERRVGFAEAAAATEGSSTTKDASLAAKLRDASEGEADAETARALKRYVAEWTCLREGSDDAEATRRRVDELVEELVGRGVPSGEGGAAAE